MGLNPVQKTSQLEQFEPDERLIVEVQKHPLGILIIYFQAGFAMIIALVIIGIFMPQIIETNPQLGAVAMVGAIILAAILALILILATMVYKGSRLVVTDKHVFQITQRGIYDRKVSQLTLNRIENVSAEQPGFFASIFNFGNIRIETAGEQDNFYFTFAEHPYLNAKKISEVWQAHRENRPAIPPGEVHNEPAAPVSAPVTPHEKRP